MLLTCITVFIMTISSLVVIVMIIICCTSLKVANLVTDKTELGVLKEILLKPPAIPLAKVLFWTSIQIFSETSMVVLNVKKNTIL